MGDSRLDWRNQRIPTPDGLLPVLPESLVLIVLACFVVVCVTLLAGLWFTLRHLVSMRATSGELAELNAEISNCFAQHNVRLKALEEKVTQLSNRLQTTR